MKKILLFLVAMMLATIARAAVGDVFSYEGLRYMVLSEADHTAEVIRNKNASGEVTIPASVVRDGVSYEYAVTSISDDAFENCSGLTSVTIPGSVTSIGEYAFQYCSGLTSVIIPGSVTKIGRSAFDNCDNLRKSAYPSGLSNPFEYGIAIAYPGKDAIIEDGFIYGPGKGAIYFAPLSIEGDYIIPESVTSIGESAFRYCSGLTSVAIPNSVTSIGESAFRYCSGLTSVAIPNSVTSIGAGAFGCCSGLTSVTIPGSVTSIEDNAFEYCSGLTSVTIPNSVTTIGRFAFYDCSGLTSVTIPGSVTSIGDYVFRGCSNLRKSAYPSGLSNPFEYGIAIEYPGKDAIIEDGFVYGPGKGAIYFAPISLEGDYSIPESVTTIGESAFSYCSSLTSVTIPNSVTEIDGYVFSGCSGLTSVTIPESVTSIEYYAFRDCSGLTSVTIPNSVTSIGEWAFEYCSGLTSVTIPNSVTRIGYGAFNGCDNLRKSAYPSGLSNPFEYGIAIEYPGKDAIIEDGFIYGPGKGAIYFAPLSLKGDYSIPESVTTIGNSAFRDCSGLTSVTIPNSVTSIGESAFRSCRGLTSVAIPNSVTTIGYYAFSGCDNLRKSAYPSGLSNPFSNGFVIEYPGKDAIIEDGFVYGPGKGAIYFAPISLEGDYSIPESVTTIGNSAFRDCSGLTSVTIPNSVTRIGNGAFEDCSGLTSVTVRSAIPPTMNDDAFEGRTYATATLSVPDNAVSTYLGTNWTLFKNLRLSDYDADCGTYETGNLKYRLIQAKAEGEENMAIVIPGDYSSLTEITIPERITVTDNGSNVRYYVDAIGYKAFNGCSSLATVTFNSSNTAKVIGDYAFAGTNISAITIPETVETIGDYAFNGCTSLKGIVIPGSVKTIGDYAFNGCSALTTAELKSGVKTIGQYAFYKTSALKEVTLNEGLESIGAYAFSASRDRNISPLYIPSTLKSVGEDAFYNFNCKYVNISDLASWCNIDFAGANSNPSAHRSGLYLNGEKIENLVIPESVTNIKDYSFCYNSALKSVVFNDELQGIGTSAFYGCSNLTSVAISGSVTTIGDNAFGSTSVRELTFAYGTESVEIGSAFPNPTKLFWDRPIECMTFNITDLNSLTIGNSITEVPADKFKGVSALTQLALGSNLTTIGDNAFSGCTSLTEVILPPSVETIGASAFAGNNSLTSIIMGHSVKNIDEKAFDLCPAQTVSITAQTPPNAPDNTFSNYTGSLYVQGRAAAEAYYNADFCWYQFEGHVMIEPTEIRVEGDKTLNGKPGDTFQLSATLYPDNVTLPQIFWRSTNPAIATVDANGLVTLHADMSDVMAMVEGDDDTAARSCKIIAESLYADGPVAEFTITDTEAGIEDIIDDSTPSGDIDFSAPVQVFNLQGVMVSDSADNLVPGIYIIRQGNAVKKVAVK